VAVCSCSLCIARQQLNHLEECQIEPQRRRWARQKPTARRSGTAAGTTPGATSTMTGTSGAAARAAAGRPRGRTCLRAGGAGGGSRARSRGGYEQIQKKPILQGFVIKSLVYLAFFACFCQGPRDAYLRPMIDREGIRQRLTLRPDEGEEELRTEFDINQLESRAAVRFTGLPMLQFRQYAFNMDRMSDQVYFCLLSQLQDCLLQCGASFVGRTVLCPTCATGCWPASSAALHCGEEAGTTPCSATIAANCLPALC